MSTFPADAAHPHEPHGAHADPHGHGDPHPEHPPHLAHHFDTPEQQFESGKLGMWVFLATELLMFGGLFCAYAIYRGNHPGIFEAGHRALSPTMGTINTVVLLASSLTMAWGVRAAQLGQRKLVVILLLLTLMGGFGFMSIKAEEYQQKFEHGFGPGVFNVFFFQGGSARDKADYMHGVEQLEGGHAGGHGDEHGDDHAAGHDAEHNGDGHAPEAAGGEQRDPATAGSGGDQPPSLPDGGAHGPADSAPSPMEGTGALAAPPSPHGESLDNAARPPVMTSMKPPAAAPAGIAAWVLTPDEKVDAGHALDFENIPADDQGRLQQFFSIYFLMTGLHGIHVLIGMGLITYLLYRAGSGVERAWTMPLLLAITGLYFGFLWWLTVIAWLGIVAGAILLSAALYFASGYARARAATRVPADGSPPPKYIPVNVSVLLLALFAYFGVFWWLSLDPLAAHQGEMEANWVRGFKDWFLSGDAWSGVLATLLLIAAVIAVLLPRYTTPRASAAPDGDFGPEYYTPVDLIGLYWHLVDLIWIFLFPLLYLIH